MVGTLGAVMIVGFMIVVAMVIGGIVTYMVVRERDKTQEQHSIRRSFPVWGRIRYYAEKMSPKFKDYFGNNTQPFSKEDLEAVVKQSKYIADIASFGTHRDYDKGGYFLNNHMFPVSLEDMGKDNEAEEITTRKYTMDKEGFFTRKEHAEEVKQDPYLLKEEDAIVLGEGTSREPFQVRGHIGMGAMSFGSIGSHGIRAFSNGLGLAKGTWMNTGEGGLSKYHLEGDVDLIVQIGPAKFGFRKKDGSMDWDELKRKSMFPNVKAFEIKLSQGAKSSGGKISGNKITPEVAEMRGVGPWKDVNSPSRFDEFSNESELLEFIDKVRRVTGKPVGIKLVVGGESYIQHLVGTMAVEKKWPDFITVDSGDGGTGKAPRAHMDSIGLGVKTSLPIVHKSLVDFKLRDKVKIIASGKLIHAERIAVALSLGADLVNTSRGLMLSAGCIMTGECDKNTCVVGLATTDPKLMNALVVDEKKYRVANYIISLRKELFSLALACGIDTPTKFRDAHITYVSEQGKIIK